MARLSIAALSAAQILIANKPEIGVESVIKISPIESLLVGKIVVNSAGAASWVAEPGASLGDGMDLHLKVDIMPTASAAPTIALDVTLEGAVISPAEADLLVPSWFPDQAKTWGEGWALDFIPQGSGNAAKLVTAVTGVTVTNVPANSEFMVFATPPISSFTEYGWKRGAQGAYNVPSTVSIPDGYNPSAAVKPGRGEERMLTLSFAHVAAGFSISRYNGKRVTVLIEVKKNRRLVHVSNILYHGYIPSASPDRGDGNDEVVETSEGRFEDCLLFTAL
jgi:hypothetical protein